MMKEMQTELESFHCPRWNELPSLALYMDQVLIYLGGIFSTLSDGSDKLPTAAMINNYVKMKLITPPLKRKYDREHLSKLIMIQTLKNVLSISEIALLFVLLSDLRDADEAYDLFCVELERTIKAVMISGICQLETDADPALKALTAALTAVSNKLLVHRIVTAPRAPSEI